MSAIGPHSRAYDVAIVGGGIAGLWLLNLLHSKNYRVILFEADTLGGEQTLASQGMIHGGLKYALSGRLTGASEAISTMPERWRQCLAGADAVDLSGLLPLTEHYYLFAEASTLGRLTSFFASRLLRGRIRELDQSDWPSAFNGFDGVVYRVDDFVLDPAALLERLRVPVTTLTYRMRITPTMLERLTNGWRISLDDNSESLTVDNLILAAGAGTAELLEAMDIGTPQMQRRPLNQVLVNKPGLPPLYAHCLTGLPGTEPRLTITSHPGVDGQYRWYIGGQLASSGVNRTDAEQIDAARRELNVCVPWIDWHDARFSCARQDRAEPVQPGGKRPDAAFVAPLPDGLVCWPTKLTLSPDLGDRVLASLPPAPDPPQPEAASIEQALPLPLAGIGQSPWNQ